MAVSPKSTAKTTKTPRQAPAKKAAPAAKKAVAESSAATPQPLDALRDSLKSLTQDNAALLAELKQKSAEIEKAISVHQKNLQRSVKAFIAEVAQEFGLTLDDLQGIARGKAKAGAKAKAEVKFCDPDNAGNTWSGRGARPKWLAEKIARGGEKFVDAASPAFADEAKALNERLAKGS